LCIPQSDNVRRSFFDHEVSREFQRPNDRSLSATRRTSEYVSFHCLLGFRNFCWTNICASSHSEVCQQETGISDEGITIALKRARSEIARRINQRIAGGSGNFVGRLCGIVGLHFVGLGQRRRRVVGLVHGALEIANRLAHRAADIAELAGPKMTRMINRMIIR
jgi:hypothetical protein